MGQVLQSGVIITKQDSAIYLATDNFLLAIPMKLNSCYNNKEEEITPPPQTYLHHYPSEVFLVLEINFIEFLETF